MLSENRAERNQMEMFCIDSFVPEDHLLRKIDEALDFGRIYEIVGDLYCHNNGRPSVDPVVLFKIVFIQHLYGIPSLRRTCEEIKMNVAYRWFLLQPAPALCILPVSYLLLSGYRKAFVSNNTKASQWYSICVHQNSIAINSEIVSATFSVTGSHSPDSSWNQTQTLGIVDFL